MDNLTELVRSEIARQYKSVRQFAFAVNIPLSGFRDRLDEVPRDRPVYLHCRTSQRSYYACCQLQNNGWTNVVHQRLVPGSVPVRVFPRRLRGPRAHRDRVQFQLMERRAEDWLPP